MIRSESGDVGTSSSYWYKVLGGIRSFRSVSGMFRSESGVFRSKSGVFQSVSDGPERVVGAPGLLPEPASGVIPEPASGVLPEPASGILPELTPDFRS